MASWAWAAEALSAGMEMTRGGMDGYVRAHPEVDPASPPATLPSAYGETVMLWSPTAVDFAADDWRLA